MDAHSILFRASLLLSSMKSMFDFGVTYSDASYQGNDAEAKDALREARSLLLGAATVSEDIEYVLKRANYRK